MSKYNMDIRELDPHIHGIFEWKWLGEFGEDVNSFFALSALQPKLWVHSTQKAGIY